MCSPLTCVFLYAGRIAHHSYYLLTRSHRLIANCCFFTPTPGDISLIITHEPIGTYKAIVFSDNRRRHNIVLSSDSLDTANKALEHLFIKSTDAVQQYMTANDFRRLPSVVDRDDDGVSSASSYVDEPDKDRLADSSLSLESELESAYESLSEDEDGTVSLSRPRTGRRPRSYAIRAGRRDSRSRSHSRSPSRSRDRAPVYYQAPAPPPRDPVHRSRAADPPQPFADPKGASTIGDVRFHRLPSQMPPRPGQGPMSHSADARGLSDPRYGPDTRVSDAHVASQQQRLVALQQQLEEDKRVFQERQRISAGLLDLDGKAVSQPSLPSPGTTCPLRPGRPSQTGPWSQFYPGNDPRPHMAPSMTTQKPWSLDSQRCQSMPQQQQPLPPQKSPIKNTHQVEMPTPPPVTQSSASYASSIASSSASSTPTVTVRSNPPPGYYSSAGWAPPASIDYRLVIKASLSAAMSEFRPDQAQQQEYRILARTPPTRSDMSAVALRYIQQHLALYVKNGAKGPLRVRVTRAVFRAGQDREESYDLAAYAENDFSKLCEIMKRAGEGEERGGLPQGCGWPLFEVVVSNIGQ